MNNKVETVIADYGDPEQGADLLTLLNEYALDPCGGGEALPTICHEELLQRLAAFPGAFSVLAYQGGKAVGLVNCFMGFSTFMCKPLVNIHDVTVSPSARGEGICTLMFEKVVAEARARGCGKITLEVLEKNLPAQAAYRKVGFRPYALDEEFGRAEFWQRYL